MGRANAECPDEFRYVFGKEHAAVRTPRLVRLAVTSEVQCNDAIALGEIRDLIFPIPNAGAQAVDEQQGLALAKGLVEEAGMIDLNRWHLLRGSDIRYSSSFILSNPPRGKAKAATNTICGLSIAQPHLTAGDIQDFDADDCKWQESSDSDKKLPAVNSWLPIGAQLHFAATTFSFGVSHGV